MDTSDSGPPAQRPRKLVLRKISKGQASPSSPGMASPDESERPPAAEASEPSFPLAESSRPPASSRPAPFEVFEARHASRAPAAYHTASAAPPAPAPYQVFETAPAPYPVIDATHPPAPGFADFNEPPVPQSAPIASPWPPTGASVTGSTSRVSVLPMVAPVGPSVAPGFERPPGSQRTVLIACGVAMACALLGAGVFLGTRLDASATPSRPVAASGPTTARAASVKPTGAVHTDAVSSPTAPLVFTANVDDLPRAPGAAPRRVAPAVAPAPLTAPARPATRSAAAPAPEPAAEEPDTTAVAASSTSTPKVAAAAPVAAAPPPEPAPVAPSAPPDPLIEQIKKAMEDEAKK